MTGKFRNRYRIKSARARWWDYGWNGKYFITICTRNSGHFFGTIDNGKMILSRLGVIADVLWYEIPRQSSHIELGNFVVMPNHIHGILILDKRCIAVKNDGDCGGRTVETLRATSLHQPATSLQQPATSLLPTTQQPTKNQHFSDISPKPGSIPAIIRSYKSAVTRHANRLGLENGWQERFHDRIIRDDAVYQRISDYIAANPKNWHRDKFRG